MSDDIGLGLRSVLRNELEALHRDWGWYLALGIALIVLGTFALGWAVLATFAAVLAYGILLLIAGVAQALGAFWSRRWSGFFLHLLEGVLYIVLGLLFLRRPGVAAAALTLLIACVLMVGGIFRIAGAVSLRFPNWGWAALSGAVSLALGLMIWSEWPASSLLVIGVFLGIEMIFNGWFWVALALSLRKLPGRIRAAVAAAPA